ncbi:MULTISPECIES: DUF3558 domain-containing protein [Nocardia]|uniref:Protein of uncharacterized function (DUF3558) n=1 Tax=Nocardia farcinica TaxID=37329 RepID=A0A0H5PI30_NOCFR|nr:MULTISPECIES: DUF3558 domain-containing protein [Nocardia]AXK87644.1 DUF3558 domain-containing protein [Nocardia farcinica]MBA4856746.1 DUF3558 domain-containing protein [Nocardia farcinica]MBC9818890.1 DUF3558 domain-containing protein [Nocardia farcinica]MBF6188689.1 DUF3558 domain-containing protein [Nocardia farcinica]MBF6234440.1 DUF3558 domain-containing protein [Nocardia farcinica]
MRRVPGRRAAALSGAVLALVAMVAGCGRTVEGAAFPAGGSQEINTNFDKLLRECDVVEPAKIGEAVGDARYVNGSFNGAVCMWDVEDAPGGLAMVTLNWYEIGSLNNEKITADKLGYSTETITVQGRRGLQVRRPGDPDSCGVTASAADTGVVGWWINYRAGSAHPDPCGAAKTLLELTLNLAR